MKQKADGKEIQRSVSVVGSSGKSVSGKVIIKEWTEAEKLRRGLKALGVCWGAMLVAVLIPVLHFLLVPLFLISGPIVALWFYQQKSTILGGKSECPDCGKELNIIKTSEKWPLKDVCSACYAQVEIVKK